MHAGLENVAEVAALAAHLPAGGAVAEWFGGQGALTQETAALWELAYITMVVNAEKPGKVKPPKYPEGVRDQQRKADFAAKQAEKYRRRQQAREHNR